MKKSNKNSIKIQKLIKFFYDAFLRCDGYSKEMYFKHRERNLQYSKEYKEKNKKKVNLQMLNWRNKNRKYIAEYNRKKTESLPDSHIIRDLKRVMPKESITPEIIKLKRGSRLLLREIKKQETQSKTK